MRFVFIIFIGIGVLSNGYGQIPGRRKVVQTTKNDDGPVKRTRSKIVNDSVKNVYGPKTTLSITEQEIFENKKTYIPLDTSIYNLHRWDFVRKYENKYQDLGNVGTALNPIFPKLPEIIGATSGFKVYDLYYESAEPKYYNTKSPFSRINVIWGGGGRAMTHIEFTRNITPRWNFGFNYRPILSVRQIQSQGKNDYQVKSQYYDFYTSYESKNSKYKLLMSYRRIRHQVKEIGGVLLTTIDTTYAGYFDPNAKTYLAGATTEELRNNFHLFHQYQLAKAAQFYHTLDLGRQINSFTDDKTQEKNAYFLYQTLDTTKVGVKLVGSTNTFQFMQNEIGFKGNAAFLFYDFYYKLRSYSNTMSGLSLQAPGAIGIENYIGSRIAFKFDSLSFLSGQAEYLLDGHYKINGSLRTPWLDADLRSSLSKPGFIQQAYLGPFNYWVREFTDIFSNQLSGRIKAKLGPVFVSPGVTYTALHNFVFFQQDSVQQAKPRQSTGNQQTISPELRMDVHFLKHFHFRPQITYTTILNNDDHAVSIPTWFSSVQLSYENTIFNGALQLHVGVDAHSNSAYRALGYAPAIQQFYVQDKFTSPSYWTTDFFLDGRIKRGRFFVKYINLIQQFTLQGYMPTPGYPNVRSNIDFGFELILFD
ncbi:hypothetical protein WSM22_47200 [Cytophagales bacterium WSM2-2]|nr:hypothetical protein WSM22_47200 [Cytophagales bacterium WSM2-2]